MKSIILIFCLIYFASCQDAETQNKMAELIEYKDSVINNNKDLNSTQVVALKDQFQKYFISIMKLDLANGEKYLYQDVFKYIQEKFPERQQSITTIKAKVFTNLRLKYLSYVNNLNADMEVYKLTKKYSHDSTLIFSFVSLLHAKMEGDDLYSGEKDLAISNDNGTSWQFVVFTHSDIPNLLRLQYSQKVIDAVMKEE
jgi:hypothetical protein